MRRMAGITFALCLILMDIYNAGAQTTPKPICTDLDRQCNIRAAENAVGIPANRTDLFMCRILQTAVNCTEEYICDCGLQVTQAMVNGHDAGYDEYSLTCQNVPDHNFRSDGGLSCRSQLVISPNQDPVNEATINEAENVFSIESAVRELDKKCPGYAVCHNTYDEKLNKTAATDWPASKKMEYLCHASLESIVCAERVMCDCGQGQNEGVKKAFRQIRHQHERDCNEDITVGYLRCEAASEPPPDDLARLCKYPVTACEERQQKRISEFTLEEYNTKNDLIICELSKINIDCIEDLICECPGMQQSQMAQQFDNLRVSYIRNCTGVEGHDLRRDEIRCKDSLNNPIDDKPEDGIRVGEIEGGLDLAALAKQIDTTCPGYEHCYNLSASYNNRALAQPTEADRTILVCEGSRMNILCLDDVLCSCGWSTAVEPRLTLRKLRHNHENFCDEDLTIGHLKCDGTRPGVEMPGRLCNNLIDTCERRVIAHYATLHDKTDYKYVSCETFKVRVKCFEDYICMCPGQQSTSMRNNFKTYKLPYEENCQDVPLHDIRKGDAYCKANFPDASTPATPPADLSRLCQSPATVCEERQAKKMADYSLEEINNRSEFFICELSKSNAKCVEDLLCECPGMQQSQLAQQFEDLRLSYMRNCTGVADHNVLRTEEIRCKDSLKDPKTDNPEEEIKLGEVEGNLDLSALAKQIDSACPGYEHCYNISKSYNDRSLNQSTEADRRILVCEGSRMNILCLDDVLCSCGWSKAIESRRTIRQLRHNHENFCDEDLTIGHLTCNGNKAGVEQAGQICQNFLDTCERRVIARYALLHDKKDYKYISCETFKVRVQCFEDYVCSCPGQQTTSLQKDFNSYKIPYEEHCQDVPPHRARIGDLYCKDKIKSGPGNAGVELGIEQAASELSIQDQAKLFDKQCPGYERCFNVTASYSKLATQQTTLAAQLGVVCEGSKYAIICLEDALCGCGWGNNTNFLTRLRDMRHQHEATCNEDLTIGYLECGGATLSISWLLTMCLTAIFLDRFLIT